MRQPSPLKFRGEHIANLYGDRIKKASVGPFDGNLTSKELRKIAAWFLRAADWLDSLK